MTVLPLRKDLAHYLKIRQLFRKFEKQKSLFEQNPFHPSLNTELLEPHRMRLWSFRVDRNYRAIFIFIAKDTIEIVDINRHYQ